MDLTKIKNFCFSKVVKGIKSHSLGENITSDKIFVTRICNLLWKLLLESRHPDFKNEWIIDIDTTERCKLKVRWSTITQLPEWIDLSEKN